MALGGPDGAPLLDPAWAWWESCGNLEVEAGVDWASMVDASAVVGLAAVLRELPFFAPGRLWLPIVVERFGTGYSDFIEELVGMGSHDRGVRFRRIASETNGVGSMPTEVLRRTMAETGTCLNVAGITTSLRSKEDQFGAVRLLLQEGRLVLPRHPSLLRQMQALEYGMLDGGSVRIRVPESKDHDDLCMALALAMSETVT